MAVEKKENFKGMEKLEEEEGGFAYEGEDSLTLESADGETLEFEVVATIYLYDDTYLIAHPTNLDDVKEDEAMVLQVVKEGEDYSYRIETDNDVIRMVFQEYYDLYEKQNKEEDDKK
ncbi:MAG: DUF1292 domain-containing protein [Bacilli bacterium]|nr:DUF1292 domain-containing protein [Bacilli bacterium]